jgi:hypothetical protein
MATENILYVGHDVSRRIPVMRSAGLTVCQTEASIPAIRDAFARGRFFSAVTFHNDIVSLPRETVWVARTLSAAPLILFENPYVYRETSDFDLVVPVLTHPARWLKDLLDVIEKHPANFANGPGNFVAAHNSAYHLRLAACASAGTSGQFISKDTARVC